MTTPPDAQVPGAQPEVPVHPQPGYVPQQNVLPSQNVVPQQHVPPGFPPGGYTPFQGFAPPAPSKGAGLAITALVLAVLAVLLCWVPLVNNFAAVLAVAGLAFGVPALISASRGKRSGKGMSVAAVILSVLAIAGVFATQAFYVSVIDDVSESIEEDFADSAAGLGTEQDADEVAEVAEAPALAVGQTATIGAYEVTITEVVPNANDVIAGVNEFNEAPKNQFVLVNATVTYNGDEEGTPWIDLSAAVLGTDGRQYDDGATSAVTPRSDEDMVTLRAGGSSEIDFLMDVPAGSLAGGKIQVEETMSFDDTAAYWAVP